MILIIKSSDEFDLSSFGIDEVWVDVNQGGEPIREIGFSHGDVVHTFPGSGKYGEYGIFDLNVFETIEARSANTEEFERVWRQANLDSL